MTEPTLKVLFRTDSSSQIGSGHLVRCLTLARQLIACGGKVQFVCRSLPGALLELCSAQNIPVHQLPAPNPEPNAAPDHREYDWSRDAEETLALIGGELFDWIIVDHYGIDERWEKQLRPACRRMMVIDDLANRRHRCELLLDQNLVSDYLNRYRSWVPGECVCLLGPEFAMLQPEYRNCREKVRPRQLPIRRILVYFGGADGYRLTEYTVASLLKPGPEQILLDQICLDQICLDQICLDVVLPRDSPQWEALQRMAGLDSRIRLHGSLPALAPLMAEADLAIGAGGASSWERCCLGLPAIVISLADNQLPIARELQRRGMVDFLGPASQFQPAMLRQAVLRQLADSRIKHRSLAAMEWVDGLGVYRVLRAIRQIGNDRWTLPAAACWLREVKEADEELVFNWINDPLVRSQSFSSDPISADRHHHWFQQTLRQPESQRYYLFEHPLEGAIGQIRFQRRLEGRSGDSTDQGNDERMEEGSGENAGGLTDERDHQGVAEWEIHFLVAAEHRGRGWGRELLRQGILSLQEEMAESAVGLLAKAKPSNLPSLRLFRSLGFRETIDPDNPAGLLFRHSISAANPGRFGK
jgi:UDP-2,4-diacetamido-2,4,6-trideoxy-beta-L-altropyranose hydrolase